ncbi:unnamed protein product, partial [Heterosigma akashiwo]
SGQQERKFCILVVDDSHISCKIAVRQLGKLGYEVDTAFSGEEALEKVGATPHRYDLMLLDIVMPGLDGIEVLSKVKGTAHLQHLPICMLSGLEDQTLAEVCLQQGALEVLLKPLKVDAVQRVVDLHCERRPQPAAGPAETLACPSATGAARGAGPQVPAALGPLAEGVRAVRGRLRVRPVAHEPARHAHGRPGQLPPQLLEFLDADTREAQKREPGGAGGPEGAGAGGEGRPAGERETIRNSDKLSVLIVDDSNISSKLALRKLVSLGYDTMHAENGKVALQLLRRFPGDFDLVLLDIVMPVMDGVELLTTMKADALLRAVPVAMLSGLEDEALAKVCLESGAEAVLRKPVNTDEVQEILQSKIGRK